MAGMGASAPVGGPGGGVLGSDFEASFRDFCSRPENKPLVEKTQRREIKTMTRATQNALAATFRERFLASPPEAQRAMAPYLQIPFLRRIVQTLSNDERGDFGQWALNPRIQAMLAQAKQALDAGHVSEAEAERLLLAHAKDPALNPEAEAFKARTALKARLSTAQLVPALNEQLQERAAGNAAYRAKAFEQALQHYERALAILEFVQGVSAADQAEVDANRVTVLWNMAAAHTGRHEHGAAVARCTEGLALAPEAPQAVRLLLRRAGAHARRHDYAAAAADYDAVKELEPWNAEAEEGLARLRAARAQHAAKDRAFAAAALRA